MTEYLLIKFSNKIQNFQECADSHEILCWQTGPHAKIFIDKNFTCTTCYIPLGFVCGNLMELVILVILQFSSADCTRGCSWTFNEQKGAKKSFAKYPGFMDKSFFFLVDSFHLGMSDIAYVLAPHHFILFWWIEVQIDELNYVKVLLNWEGF